MKKCVYGISILLSIALLSCSKPVEPTRNPSRPVVKPAAQNFSLESREIVFPTQGGENTPVPEGFKVTVLDDESDEPISYASVKLKWRIHVKWGIYYKLFMRDAVNNGDGTYCICTNKLFDSNQVSVAAEGYLPAALENARFPLTVKLKRGETVNVYGTVYAADGNSVSGACLSIQPLNGTVWTNDELSMVSCCDTSSGEDGQYEMAAVPKYLDRLFLRFTHPEYQTVDMTNTIFDTYDKDVCIDVVLPRFLELKGQVTFDTGVPVPGAQVWVEKHTGTNVEPFFSLVDDHSYCGIENANTKADSNGFFFIRTLAIVPYYAVKAKTDMHLPTMTGIFTSDNPAPDFITLVIKTEGARIAGRISDTHDKPITNVLVRYTIGDESGMIGRSQELGLEIEADGSYLSQIISPGPYETYFYAPGHKRVRKNISVRSDDVTIVDVIFPEYEQINGVVINPLSGEPIPGVTLSNIRQRTETSTHYSPVSAADGTFWVRLDRYKKIHFSHPGYGSTIVSFVKNSVNSNTVYEVYLSPAVTVSVHVDGTLHGNDRDYTVVLQYPHTEDSFAIFTDFMNGKFKGKTLNSSFTARKSLKSDTAVFTNVPAHYSPICAQLYKNRIYTLLGESEPYELTKNETTYISLPVFPMGSLEVSLAHPYQRRVHYFSGEPIFSNRDKFITSFNIRCNGIASEKKLMCPAIPTNTYKVKYFEHDKKVYESNIVIRAGETTEIFIDYKTNAYGSIRGRTVLADSTPVDCVITVYTSGNHRVKSWQSFQGEFIIKQLDLSQTYSLSAMFIGIGHTNVTVDTITPGGPVVTVNMGNAYRINGTLIDGNGKPLAADIRAGSIHRIGPGDFSLYPVLPGRHTLVFNVIGYTPVIKEVTVTSYDIDLGNIICNDKGYSVYGIVVKPDGTPAVNTTVILVSAEGRGSKNTKTDSNGKFIIKNLAGKTRYRLIISHDNREQEVPVGTITGDTDLGELKLK